MGCEKMIFIFSQSILASVGRCEFFHTPFFVM